MRVVAIGLECGGRADEHDGPARLLEMRHRNARQHHPRHHVRIEGVEQELLRVAIDGLAVHVGRIVDQPVEFAAMLEGRGQHRLPVRLHGHVPHHDPACGSDRLGDGLELVAEHRGPLELE